MCSLVYFIIRRFSDHFCEFKYFWNISSSDGLRVYYRDGRDCYRACARLEWHFQITLPRRGF